MPSWKVLLSAATLALLGGIALLQVGEPWTTGLGNLLGFLSVGLLLAGGVRWAVARHLRER